MNTASLTQPARLGPTMALSTLLIVPGVAAYFAAALLTEGSWLRGFFCVGAATAVGSVTALALRRRAASAAGAHAGFALAAALLVQTSLPLLGALDALSKPIVSSELRCGNGEAMTLLVMPFFAAILAGAGALATHLLAPRAGARTARVAGVASTAALVAAGALCAASIPRAITHVPIGAYGDKYPVIGTLPSVALPGVDPSREHIPTEERVYNNNVGGIGFVRACRGYGCRLTLVQEIGITRDYRWGGVYLNDGALRLRADRAHGLVLVEQPGGWRCGAFRLLTRAAMSVRPRDVASDLAPPWPWIACAALGVALALLVPRATRSWVAPYERLLGARQGVLRDGSITFDDGGPPVAWPTAVTGPSGPVLVLSDEAPAAPHYREAGAIRAGTVVRGTLDEARALLATARGGQRATQLALVAWSTAPLAVAAMQGLVF